MALQWGLSNGVSQRGLNSALRWARSYSNRSFRRKATTWHSDSGDTGDDNRSAVGMRDRAMARVRRITAADRRGGHRGGRRARGVGGVGHHGPSSSVATRTPRTTSTSAGSATGTWADHDDGGATSSSDGRPSSGRRPRRRRRHPRPRSPRRPARPPGRRRHRVSHDARPDGDGRRSPITEPPLATRSMGAIGTTAVVAVTDPDRADDALGHDGRGSPVPRRRLQPVPARLGAPAAGADRRGPTGRREPAAVRAVRGGADRGREDGGDRRPDRRLGPHRARLRP